MISSCLAEFQAFALQISIAILILSSKVEML